MAEEIKRRDYFNKTLLVLAIIGALNWGLIGFFNWNLVDAILGGGAREQVSAASRAIYALVGLAGLVLLFSLPWRTRGVFARKPRVKVPV